MRCVFIHNSVSGRARSRRAEKLRAAAETLTARGHRIELISTTGPGSASVQARQCVTDGAEIVFACGGDGTVHEVIQGLVFESGEPTATLGIIPLGSANALARHLGLSLDPCTAAVQQMEGTAKTISIGKVTYDDRSRYFAVMVGAGPDGALAYEVLAEHKSRLGRFAYYFRAARLFLSRRFHSFEIEYNDAKSKHIECRKAVSVMAVRVNNLGGLFSKLAGQSTSIDDAHLRLLILGPPAVLSLPLWFASGWLNLHHLNPFLRFVDVSEFSCRFQRGHDVKPPHIQADGEWLGHIPMTVSIVPGALRILVPSHNGKH